MLTGGGARAVPVDHGCPPENPWPDDSFDPSTPSVEGLCDPADYGVLGPPVIVAGNREDWTDMTNTETQSPELTQEQVDSMLWPRLMASVPADVLETL